MFFELKGVDPSLIEHFSFRREEIERQVAAWKEEGRFAEVPEGRLYEMAALETRDPKRSMTREEVAGIFERVVEACGTSSVADILVILEVIEEMVMASSQGRDLGIDDPVVHAFNALHC